MDSTKTTLLLCGLGLFKEFRPSEPFLSPFLYGPKNFTELEINNEIYPIGTYSHMSLLIFVFLLTDWLRYKPIIILQCVSGICTWAILIWGKSVLEFQVGQIFYGLFSACDVAYFSYLYAKIDKKKYQKATAQTKAVILVSKSFSGLIAQLLVMYKILNYTELNYITIIALSISVVWAIFLPNVTNSSYFNREIQPRTPLEVVTEGNRIEETEKIMGDATMGSAVVETVSVSVNEKPHIADRQHRKRQFKYIYGLWRESVSNPRTLKWSVWAALSMCGYLQVTYYIQLLWQSVINSDRETNKVYHGFSSTFNSLAGAMCTYGVGYLNLDWSKYGEITLASAALAQGAILLVSTMVESTLIVHYIEYAAFKILYQASSTIATAEIAKSLKSESYGLVLGINQFVALVEQSIITVMVTTVFAIDIKAQFKFYGAYFIIIALGFLMSGAVSCLKLRCGAARHL